MAAIFAPILNLFAVAIEGLIRLVLPDFSIGRMERKRAGAGQVVLGLVVIGAIVWVFAGPSLTSRKVTFVAADGYSIPFAAVTVCKGGEESHRRTDSAGNLKVPRFGLERITLKDPRYLETSWTGNEVTSRLEVERTVLGAGLDQFADRLLRKARE